MQTGTAYYPDYQKTEMWKVNYEKIKNGGMKRIRIAEFAWTRMEPQKGVFNWEWLDESIQLAAEYGIEVVLCTPTACPPIWLVEECPQVLPVNVEGRRTLFGARQHRCYNSPAYKEYSLRVVEEMGRRYGNHPNVVAWQLDNEFGGEQKRCYCNNCRKAFQSYLQEKYNTITELNERWGNCFWSKQYQRFDQIPVPQKLASDLAMKHDPSLELEFTRFSSDTIIQYSRMQARILRKYTGNTPITTNAFLFRWGDNLDWYELFKELDTVGIDIYSDKLYEISFYADIIRSLKDRSFWTMEYGTGSKQLMKEMDQLQGRGCDWLFFFKFNPFPWGNEQGTRDLLNICGQPTSGYNDARAWVKRQEGEGVINHRFKASGIGIYYDFDSSWVYSRDEYLKYPQYLIHVVYQSIFREDETVKIIFNKQGIQDVDTLILPLIILYDSELEDALMKFVADGGKLFLTSDLFQKNKDNVYMEEIPQLYRKLLDWHENDYLHPEDYISSPLIRTAKYGAGETWMLKSDATLEDWKLILKDQSGNNKSK